jgi:hypothetical protein
MNVEVDDRAGIDRAFDVIRNHTVHTKGYVLTALKMIEEYGSSSDKALLETLLQEKNGAIRPKAKSVTDPAAAPTRKRKPSKSR